MNKTLKILTRPFPTIRALITAENIFFQLLIIAVVFALEVNETLLIFSAVALVTIFWGIFKGVDPFRHMMLSPEMDAAYKFKNPVAKKYMAAVLLMTLAQILICAVIIFFMRFNFS